MEPIGYLFLVFLVFSVVAFIFVLSDLMSDGNIAQLIRSFLQKRNMCLKAQKLSYFFEKSNDISDIENFILDNIEYLSSDVTKKLSDRIDYLRSTNLIKEDNKWVSLSEEYLVEDEEYNMRVKNGKVL